MPANLSPGYMAAEERFREARTPEEKRAALEEMLRTIPKHKGTEKLQADIKRRLARLRKEKTKKGAHTGPSHHVDKEGMSQFLLIGPPNAGKSQIQAALSNAHPQVAPYPYATREPAPAVMVVRKARVQLVDTPSISEDYWEAWMSPVIRVADAVGLVADLGSHTCLEDLDAVLQRLEEAGIHLEEEPPGEVPLGAPRPCRMRTLLLCNKADAPRAEMRWEVLRDLYGERFQMYRLSAQEGTGLAEAADAMFQALRVVRVFTKDPHGEPSMDDPILVPEGSTVMDVALAIHKDLVAHFQFARVWGSAKFDGQKVERDHVMADGDIIEIHT